MKASICATSTSNPLMRPTKRRADQHQQNRERPGDAVPDLEADRENVPHHDAEADGQVDPAGHHRQRRAERQQRDDRLVGEDRAAVEPGRKRVRQQEREQDDQQERQERQAVDRRAIAEIFWPRDQPGEFGRVGSSALDLMRLHSSALDYVSCSAAARRCWRRRQRADSDRQIAAAQFRRPPGRGRTPARGGRLWRPPRNRWRR